MSSNAPATTNKVATLTSTPKAQTAKDVIAANIIIQQLEAGRAESTTARHLIVAAPVDRGVASTDLIQSRKPRELRVATGCSSQNKVSNSGESYG
jgi:hypothetical protein